MSEYSPEENGRRFLSLVHQASIRLAARGQRFALVDATKRATPRYARNRPHFQANTERVGRRHFESE